MMQMDHQQPLNRRNLIEDVDRAGACVDVCISLHWKVNRLDNSLCTMYTRLLCASGRDGENEKQIVAHKLMVIYPHYI